MNKFKLSLIPLALLGFSSSAFAIDFSQASATTRKIQSVMARSNNASIARAAGSVTSASAVISRGNIVRAIKLATGFTPLGILRTVAVGVILDQIGSRLTANPDGTVTALEDIQVPSSKGFNVGDKVYKCGNPYVLTTSVGACASQFNATSGFNTGRSVDPINCPAVTTGYLYCTKYKTTNGQIFNGQLAIGEVQVAGVSCPDGYKYSTADYGCVPDGQATMTGQQTTTTTYENLPTIVPAEVLDRPLTQAQTATVIGAINSGINSKTGYVPTDIQPGDVPVPTASDPALTLRDLTTPVPPGVQLDESTNPASATGTQDPTTTKVVPDPTATKIDLGPDPGIMAPKLDLTPPTAQSIVDPFLNMLPGFRNMGITGPVGTCVVTSFTIFGKVYTFQIICDLLESNAATIRAFMNAFFLILSVIIILRA